MGNSQASYLLFTVAGVAYAIPQQSVREVSDAARVALQPTLSRGIYRNDTGHEIFDLETLVQPISWAPVSPAATILTLGEAGAPWSYLISSPPVLYAPSSESQYYAFPDEAWLPAWSRQFIFDGSSAQPESLRLIHVLPETRLVFGNSSTGIAIASGPRRSEESVTAALIVRHEDWEVAIPGAQALRVTNVGNVLPIAGAHRYVVGWVIHQRKPLLLVDLLAQVGRRPQLTLPRQAVQIEDPKLPWAVVVSRGNEIARVTNGWRVRLGEPIDASGSERGVLIGFLQRGERRVPLLDLRRHS